MVSDWGGMTFLLPYVLFVVLIASTGVIEEMALGRAAKSGPIRAFGKCTEIRTGNKRTGEVIGVVPVLGSLALAIGYTVVVGWIFKYTFLAITGGLYRMGQDMDAISGLFGGTASSFGNNLWQVIAMIVTGVIMAYGIAGGIEKANKVMMPLLFVLFLGLGAYIFTLPGSGHGYRYIFTLNPQGLLNPRLWIYAFGQAFFSLSIAGNGTVIYGSYLSDEENVVSSARNVAVFDTLAALRLSKELGYLGSLAICNVPGSSLVRESDLALMTNAGTEIGVASTKAFTTQLTVLLMLVAKLSRLKGLDASIEHDIVHGLQALPSRIEQMLSQDKRIEALAEDFSDKHHALFLGRGDQYPIALEGALKLKEISYIHAEAYAAGELKHGPLALIDADMPVIVVAPNNELLEKLKSNIEEVRARGGQLYVFADQDAGFVSSDNMHIIEMPHVEETIAPIFYTVPLQLLAYHVALIKGTDVDQPRNLAKSVTVE